MLLQALVDREEDDALLFQILPDAVVDHLRLVLGAQASQELALRFRHAQPVKGLLDILRDIIPGALFALGGLDIVIDLIVVYAGEIRTPGRNRLGLVNLQRLKTVLQHPLRLAFDAGNLPDNVGAEALAALERVLLRIAEPVLLRVFGVQAL